MQDVMGTPFYISPEVLKGDYDEKCDLWSMGVITFFLLSGKRPFNGEDEVIEEKIQTCDYTFEAEDWRGISVEAKKFIKALIEPRVGKRLSAEQALQHAWIKNSKPTLSGEDEQDVAEIFLRLKTVKRLSKFE